MSQTETNDLQKLSTSGNQYLTFSLGSEEYGIELLKVQEIKGYAPVTPIPNTPSHIKGVMNLRGTVIPIVDLRSKFSMESIEYTKFNVIIVINVGSKVMGLLVDAVSDVLTVGENELRPAPDFGSRADTRFISGLASVGEKIAVLLDVDCMLTEAELSAGDEALATPA